MKIPSLDLSNLLESSEECDNEMVKNLTIKYTLAKHLNSNEELKYYNKLYDYKKKLGKREIKICMNDVDLMYISSSDDPICLRLVVDKSTHTPDRNTPSSTPKSHASTI